MREKNLNSNNSIKSDMCVSVEINVIIHFEIPNFVSRYCDLVIEC